MRSDASSTASWASAPSSPRSSTASAADRARRAHPRTSRAARVPLAALLASLLALAGLLGAGCGGTQSAPPPRDNSNEAPRLGTSGGELHAAEPGRAPTSRELEALRGMMQAAERLRALRFLEPVDVRILSRAEISAEVEASLEDDELEESRVFYTALGLLPEGVDLRALLVSLMGEQVVGFYDAQERRMVIRDDVMASVSALLDRGESLLGDSSAMVLVHEYVHALQDQHFDLRREFDRERTIDEANAYSALVEGDATLTMLGAQAGAQGSQVLQLLTRDLELLRRQLAQMPPPSTDTNSELDAAPAIVRVPLMARYLDGLVFTAALHGGHARAGASGYAAIDATFRAPVRTTAAILHPERRLPAEGPPRIELPPLASMVSAGFTALDDETLGELELAVYFDQRNPSGSGRDASAAAGWDGDRIRVYRRAEASRGGLGAMAFAWLSRWDDDAEAIEAESAARGVGRAVASPAGALTVARTGRVLSITAGLTSEAEAELARARETLAATGR